MTDNEVSSSKQTSTWGHITSNFNLIPYVLCESFILFNCAGKYHLVCPMTYGICFLFLRLKIMLFPVNISGLGNDLCKNKNVNKTIFFSQK